METMSYSLSSPYVAYLLHMYASSFAFIYYKSYIWQNVYLYVHVCFAMYISLGPFVLISAVYYNSIFIMGNTALISHSFTTHFNHLSAFVQTFIFPMHKLNMCK